MSRFILITFFLLTLVCLLLADGNLAVMRCDDNTTVKHFNLCIPRYGGSIKVSCEISSDTYRSNHGFKVYTDGSSERNVLPKYSPYTDYASYELVVYNYVNEEKSLRFQCYRYNNTEDEKGTAEKVCSKAEVHVYRCAGPEQPTELVAQEAEHVTLHCLDAPEDADIQWYFTQMHDEKKLLGTGYTIKIRNLTSEASGDYTCVAVKNTSKAVTTYSETTKLKVHEHFRTAYAYVTKREEGSLRFRCFATGITSQLDHVVISKWTAQYSSLSPGQYNKWSTAEASGDRLQLTGLTPSTWYLMKGQVTDSTGKTAPMAGYFFRTFSPSDQSPAMEILSDRNINSTFLLNDTEHIDHEDTKRLSVMVGEDVVVECGFNMDHLTAHFDFEANWTRGWNERLPKDSGKYKQKNQALVIKDFSPQDAEDYECRLKATPKSANAGFTEASLQYSVKVNVTRPAGVLLPPLDVQCVNRTKTTVTMSWSDNPRNTDIKGYKVQYWTRTNGDAAAEKTEVFLPKNAQGVRNEFTGLQPRTAYGFKIRAVDSVGYKSDATIKSCATL